MKKYLFITFLFPFLLSAQNEYFQNNPSWLVYDQYSQFYPCVNNDSCIYYISGDVVIGPYTYKEISKHGHVTDQWWSTNPNINCYGNYSYVESPSFYVRSDSGRIYYRITISSPEYLMYDYNLTIGDTVPPSAMVPSGNVVTSIDSFFTSHGYVQRFYVNGSFTEYLIEGAGSSYGFDAYFGVHMDGANTLLCYGLNDTAWWPAPGAMCTVLLNAAVSDHEGNQISIQLYPNPVNDLLFVQGLEGRNADAIEVCDALGMLVKCESNVSEFSVEDLATGIYFVRVTSGEMQMTQRLIVE